MVVGIHNEGKPNPATGVAGAKQTNTAEAETLVDQLNTLGIQLKQAQTVNEQMSILFKSTDVSKLLLSNLKKLPEKELFALFDKLFSNPKLNSLTKCLLAQTMVELGHTDKAIELTRQIPLQDDKDAAYSKIAIALLKKDKPSAARTVFDKIKNTKCALVNLSPLKISLRLQALKLLSETHHRESKEQLNNKMKSAINWMKENGYTRAEIIEELKKVGFSIDIELPKSPYHRL